MKSFFLPIGGLFKRRLSAAAANGGPSPLEIKWTKVGSLPKAMAGHSLVAKRGSMSLMKNGKVFDWNAATKKFQPVKTSGSGPLKVTSNPERINPFLLCCGGTKMPGYGGIWLYDQEKQAWTKVKTQSMPINDLKLLASTSDSLFAFGKSALHDQNPDAPCSVARFDLTNKKGFELMSNTTGQGPTELKHLSVVAPPASWASANDKHGVRDQVYVFDSGDLAPTLQVNVFDGSSGRWVQPKIDAELAAPPPPLRDFAVAPATVAGRHFLLIWGGYSVSFGLVRRSSAQAYALELPNGPDAPLRWVPVSQSPVDSPFGACPGPRYSTSLLPLGSGGDLVLGGGRNDIRKYSDLYLGELFSDS